MQNVKSKCIFFLIFLLLYARRIGGLPLRWLSLRSCRVRPRVRPLRADNSYLAMLERFLRPRVRHFVYCVRIAFGHSQMRRPARFVLNADVAPFLYSARYYRA